MKITLINLPWREGELLGVRAGSRWPFKSAPEPDGKIHYIPFPFFLAYATSLLKKAGKDATLIDAIAEGINEDECIKQIAEHAPSLVVIETSTPSFSNDVEIALHIKNRLPDCRLALCGPHASVFAEQILKESQCIDYILIGEYEYTLLELATRPENYSDLGLLKGLVYRENGKVKINQPRSTSMNLDDLPWPEREDVPIYNYNDGFAGLPQPNVQMWTSRGCPFRCSFCLWPQAFYREHKYRMRTPRDVVDEMQYLIDKYDFKAIYFDDDVFNINSEHVLNICSEIRKRDIKIPWATMARADLMDEAMLEALSISGLFAIKYGLESVNEGVLRLCNKDMDLDKTYRMIWHTKQLGIKVHLTFCVGLPGETEASLKETQEFIRKLEPDSVQFSFATPFPGTQYFDYVKERGLLLSEDWSDFDGNEKCIVQTGDLTREDIEAAKKKFAGGLGCP